MAKRVVIVGGGLAGLSAATALASWSAERNNPLAITLIESRARLGGRAGSFQDPATGQLVDACQHVSMGCCTNFADWCKIIGVDRYLQPQPLLYFMTPDRQVSRFGADPLPAPLHLARSFAAARYLTLDEKYRAGLGLLAIKKPLAEGEDPPFTEWLKAHKQPERVVNRFWGLILVSALNESPDRIGLKYARKVFVDGFLKHRRGFEVQLPSVALGNFYGAELRTWLEQHRVEIILNRGVKRYVVEGDRVSGIEMRDAEVLPVDLLVSALPFDRLLDVLGDDVVRRHEAFQNLRRLATSPITSLHFWWDRSATNLPHVVFLDSASQWLFNRGETTPGEFYTQVVVSAARQFRGLGREEVQRQVYDELLGFFPHLRQAKLLRVKVVTEHAATFSAVPGVDAWRPAQQSPIANLFLAGDWTKTEWPATMEGAVRSGRLAAEALSAQLGTPTRFLTPDLA